MHVRSDRSSVGFVAVPLIFLLVTAGILALGGYFVYQTVKSGKTSLTAPMQKVTQLTTGLETPKISQNDFSFIADPLIRRQFAAQANVQAYRTHGSSSGLGSDQTIITEVQFDSNGARLRTIQQQNGKETRQTVVIGDTTYMKDYTDNAWWEETAKREPSPTGEQPKQYLDWKPADVAKQVTDNKTTYKSLGTEVCGNLTCYKYEEMMGDIKRTFWFDTKELLLRKQESGYGEFTSAQEFSYDGISITPPSPTKGVPNGKSILEMQSIPARGDDARGEGE